MDYRILGPVDVVRDGVPVRLGGHRQRAVLTLLLLNANHVVPAHGLIDRLWAGTPPSGAATTLQVYVSNLRAALEPDRPPRTPASILVSVPPGYLLRVDSDEVDASRFAGLLEHGRAEARANRPARAREILEQALGMWRGEPLAEFADEPFARAEIQRLNGLRMTAVEELVDAKLALGEHTALAAELSGLVTEHPLRERLREQLMVALYRCGRQSEALAVARQGRERLVTELGIDPGPGLRRVEEAILRQDPGLELSQTTIRPPSGEDPLFVGRDTELATLDRLWAGVRAGSGHLVFLAGEAGIGKTRLAATWTARAPEATVAWGCGQQGGAPELWPWAEVLGSLVTTLPEAEVRDAAGADAPYLVSVVPELAQHLPALGSPAAEDPRTRVFRQYNSIIHFLVRLSHNRPLLVVLDDVHWADPASLRLAGMLVAHLDRNPILVLATYRDTDVAADQPLAGTLAALAGKPAVDRITLAGLNTSEVERWITGSLRTPIAPELATAVSQRTNGNPLFLSQLLRWISTEAPDADTLGALAGTAVPTEVREVIAARAGRLGQDAVRVLTVGAVAGQEFTLDVLEQVGGLDAARTLEAVEAALSARLLTEPEPGRFRFVHALVQEALTSALSAARRSRLHADVGRALEQPAQLGRPVLASELAFHFLAGVPAGGCADKAAEWALRAADNALNRSAYQEAMDLLDRVLAAVPATATAPATRCDLLLRLAEARQCAGLVEQARDAALAAAQIARSEHDRARLAAAALACSAGELWGAWREFGRVDEESVALLEEALRALGPEDSPERAVVLGRLAVQLYFSNQVSRRERLARQAVATARRLGDQHTLGQTLDALHSAMWRPGNARQRLAVSTELLDVAQASDTLSARMKARYYRMLSLMELGEVAAADAEYDEFHRIAEKLGQPSFLLLAQCWRVMRQLMTGRYAEVERTIADLPGHVQNHGSPVASRYRAYNQATLTSRLLRDQQRLDELEPRVREFADRGAAHWRPELALVLAETGQQDEAARILNALMAMDFVEHPDTLAWLPCLVTQAEACAALRAHEHAPRLHRLLLPYAGQVVATGAFFSGSVDYYLGLLQTVCGHHDEAVTHLRAALEQHQRMGAVPWVARSQHRLAQALLARNGNGNGDRDQARTLLSQARSTAHQIGMTGLLSLLDAPSTPDTGRVARNRAG